jgi:hypothetical protein
MQHMFSYVMSGFLEQRYSKMNPGDVSRVWILNMDSKDTRASDEECITHILKMVVVT